MSTVNEDKGQQKCLYAAGGSVCQHNHFEKFVHILVKLKTYTSYDTVISLLNTFPGGIFCLCAPRECRRMLTAVFVTEF